MNQREGELGGKRSTYTVCESCRAREGCRYSRRGIKIGRYIPRSNCTVGWSSAGFSLFFDAKSNDDASSRLVKRASSSCLAYPSAVGAWSVSKLIPFT